jgi:hypothetical protein
MSHLFFKIIYTKYNRFRQKIYILKHTGGIFSEGFKNKEDC